MTWRGSAKRSGTKSLLRCVQTWWPTTINVWPLWLPTRVLPPSTKSCLAKGSNTYLTPYKANQFITFFKCVNLPLKLLTIYIYIINLYTYVLHVYTLYIYIYISHLFIYLPKKTARIYRKYFILFFWPIFLLNEWMNCSDIYSISHYDIIFLWNIHQTKL